MDVLVFALAVVVFFAVLDAGERYAQVRQDLRLADGLEECRECGETAHHEIDGVPLCDPCAEMHEEEMCA